MPVTKRMVKRSAVEIAKGKRKCKFTQSEITKGSVCLVVYDAPRARFCYSRDVGLSMVSAARARLDAIEAALRGGVPFE